MVVVGNFAMDSGPEIMTSFPERPEMTSFPNPVLMMLLPRPRSILSAWGVPATTIPLPEFNALHPGAALRAPDLKECVVGVRLRDRIWSVAARGSRIDRGAVDTGITNLGHENRCAGV